MSVVSIDLVVGTIVDVEILVKNGSSEPGHLNVHSIFLDHQLVTKGCGRKKSTMLKRRNCENGECMIRSRARHKVHRRIGGSQVLTLER